MEGFPMRKWNIEIWLLNEAGEEVQADVFEKVVYELHPSFAKPKQSMCLTSSEISPAIGLSDVILRCLRGLQLGHFDNVELVEQYG
jgi:hypothetical protein